MAEEQEELTSSEEYEEKALALIGDGTEAPAAEDAALASVYAQLALAATIREATFVIAELIDPQPETEKEE